MKINLIGPICQTGYGLATVNILHSLTELGHQVNLYPISKDMQAHPKLHNSIKISLDNAENKSDFEAPCIRIWHQFEMSQFVGYGQHIGFPIFELDRFTEREKYHLGEGCNRLFVCSKWARQICYDNNLPNEATSYVHQMITSRLGSIKIVPLGVDNEIFHPAKSHRKNTIFYNAGKWEYRKGHDILIQAFNKAFELNDNVELWMSCHNPFYTDDENAKWVSKYKGSKLGDKIRIIPYQETQSQVADIMRQTDCGIFPYRAEGWNLELLEMMACGKQTIATNYSGPTEFCNDNNCNLIDIDGMELAEDGKWFHKQGSWAKLGENYLSNIIDIMRRIHVDKQKNGSMIYQAGLETAQKYSWQNSAQTIINILENK